MITGDTTTPTNCVLSSTGYGTVQFAGGSKVLFQGFQVNSITGSGSAVLMTGKSDVQINKLTFPATNRYHFEVLTGSHLTLLGDHAVTGAGACHIYLATNAIVTSNSAQTGTITGTPAFSAAFIQADTGAVYLVFNQTWTGSATGKRYDATLNSVIYTFGAGATHFPGNVAGTTATGGQYA